MMPELTLIVPCLNEENNVAELAFRFLHSAKLHKCSAEIVFVDDGSTDKTLLRLREIETEFSPRVKVLSNQSNLGIAGSWSAGLREANGRVVSFLDADLQSSPEDVFRLFEVLQSSDSDLVRGVRINALGFRDSRYAMSRLLNWLLNLTFCMNSRDNKSGFIVVEHRLALQLIEKHQKFRYFQTFLGVAAETLGFRTVEIETLFAPRRSGQSFLRKRWLWVGLAVLREFPLARRMFSPRKTRVRK